MRMLQQVLVKGDERLADVISQYAKDSGADLVVVGSQNLCVDGEQHTVHSHAGSCLVSGNTQCTAMCWTQQLSYLLLAYTHALAP